MYTKILANCLNELCLIDKKSVFRCPNITALNDRALSCKQFIREDVATRWRRSYFDL